MDTYDESWYEDPLYRPVVNSANPDDIDFLKKERFPKEFSRMRTSGKVFRFENSDFWKVTAGRYLASLKPEGSQPTLLFYEGDNYRLQDNIPYHVLEACDKTRRHFHIKGERKPFSSRKNNSFKLGEIKDATLVGEVIL